MSLWKILCLVVAITFALLEASPLLQRQDVRKNELSGQIAEADNTLSKIPQRKGRQNYFYDYPFSFPYDFFKSPSYPDYFNPYYDPSSYYSSYQSNQKQYPYPYGPYPSKKKTRRRKGNSFEPTTQKYTVWDLARK